MAKKGGLGRGFESLFAENSADTNAAVTIRLSEIEPNRNQPRKEFDEEALQELADSISKTRTVAAVACAAYSPAADISLLQVSADGAQAVWQDSFRSACRCSRKWQTARQWSLQ